jgi:hypothetical protein
MWMLMTDESTSCRLGPAECPAQDMMPRRKRLSPAARIGIRLSAFSAALLLGSAAIAGPPYTTDDPVPTDPGKWEVFGFVEGSHAHHLTEGEAGFDINYGAAKDLQVTAVLPLSLEHEGGTRAGIGSFELGAKYRFVHQDEEGWSPEVSFYPSVEIPTGGRFSSGHVAAFLPLWAQKDLGKWSLFGGAGYGINPGAGNKDFVFVGAAATREIGERLELGAEVSHQTGEEKGQRAWTHVGVGGAVKLSEKWSLLASAGPDFGPGAEHGQATFYVGIAFAN